MTCEHTRWLLSLDPTGRMLAQDPAATRHLDACDACQAFARAMAAVDEALAVRPLAQPRRGLAPAVVSAAGRCPRQGTLEQPFSRPFWVLAAAVTLVALAASVLLLQQASAGPLPGAGGAATQLWLNPTWPNVASAWLSLQAEHAARPVLAALTGLVVTIAGAAVGFRASERRAHK